MDHVRHRRRRDRHHLCRLAAADPPEWPRGAHRRGDAGLHPPRPSPPRLPARGDPGAFHGAARRRRGGVRRPPSGLGLDLPALRLRQRARAPRLSHRPARHRLPSPALARRAPARAGPGARFRRPGRGLSPPPRGAHRPGASRPGDVVRRRPATAAARPESGGAGLRGSRRGAGLRRLRLWRRPPAAADDHRPVRPDPRGAPGAVGGAGRLRQCRCDRLGQRPGRRPAAADAGRAAPAQPLPARRHHGPPGQRRGCWRGPTRRRWRAGTRRCG
jgi:hypothetical protein